MHDGSSKQNVVDKKGRKTQRDVQILFVIGALALVVLVMYILNPRFLSGSNILNISRAMSINMIVAVGMTLCIINGGIDLSVGAVGIMSGCITGQMLILTNQNIPVSILVGLGTGALCGFVNGLAIAKIRMLPFICTLAMMTFARGAALAVTGGYILSGFSTNFTYIGTGIIAGIPVPTVIMAVIVALGWVLLSKTEFGLNVYAVGGNKTAAVLSGLKVDSLYIKVYMLSGVLAAVGGIVMTARLVSAQPNLMATTHMDAIAAVVVGGTSLKGGQGSMGRTLIGCLLITSLTNGLNIVGLAFEWQQMAIGAIIFLAVTVDMLTRGK